MDPITQVGFLFFCASLGYGLAGLMYVKGWPRWLWK